MDYLEGKIKDTRKRIEELELLISAWEKQLKKKQDGN
tara:strand:+ start:228 stop:338 length:111 start_codon:yes stop_codon:yes gene_type:complete